MKKLGDAGEKSSDLLPAIPALHAAVSILLAARQSYNKACLPLNGEFKNGVKR